MFIQPIMKKSNNTISILNKQTNKQTNMLSKVTKFNQSLVAYNASAVSKHTDIIMCKKACGSGVGKATEQETTYASEANGFIQREPQRKICVLPKGHKGRCCCNLKKFFKK